MPTLARRTIALVALAVAISAAAALDLPSAAAQSADEQTGRIIARGHDKGWIEFGWLPTDADGVAVGEPVFPNVRYFALPFGYTHWLNSGPVEIRGPARRAIGVISARRLANGWIEFAFTRTDGERILPQFRHLPPYPRVDLWGRSSEITISAAPLSASQVPARTLAAD